MAENSKIEWTDHTFNPWWGCTKVSSACDNCYAEAWAKRTGHRVWGYRAERRFLSEIYWKQPLRWNKEAKKQGRRARVFCASMADVFEWRSDLKTWREKLWVLIDETPNLDWLILTKRPHLISRLSPWGQDWPQNVWLGTTVESQEFAEKRIPHLVENPAMIRFLSCEPLRSGLDLSIWLEEGAIDWVIAGGESGPGARPSDPAWFRDLRDQCIESSVAFHFKQWGDWAPLASVDPIKIPSSLDVENWSEPVGRFGKKVCARSLDNFEWDELPIVSRETQRVAAL